MRVANGGVQQDGPEDRLELPRIDAMTHQRFGGDLPFAVRSGRGHFRSVLRASGTRCGDGLSTLSNRCREYASRSRESPVRASGDLESRPITFGTSGTASGPNASIAFSTSESGSTAGASNSSMMIAPGPLHSERGFERLPANPGDSVPHSTLDQAGTPRVVASEQADHVHRAGADTLVGSRTSASDFAARRQLQMDPRRQRGDSNRAMRRQLRFSGYRAAPQGAGLRY